MIFKEYYVSEEDSAALALTKEVAMDDEDYWSGYEGQCQACDAYVRVNDMSMCDECAGKLERDLIRQREWDYCASAFGLPEEAREALRNGVIRQHGSKLELIAPSRQAGGEGAERRPKRGKI